MAPTHKQQDQSDVPFTTDKIVTIVPQKNIPVPTTSSKPICSFVAAVSGPNFHHMRAGKMNITSDPQVEATMSLTTPRLTGQRAIARVRSTHTTPSMTRNRRGMLAFAVFDCSSTRPKRAKKSYSALLAGKCTIGKAHVAVSVMQMRAITAK